MSLQRTMRNARRASNYEIGKPPKTEDAETATAWAKRSKDGDEAEGHDRGVQPGREEITVDPLPF